MQAKKIARRASILSASARVLDRLRSAAAHRVRPANTATSSPRIGGARGHDPSAYKGAGSSPQRAPQGGRCRGRGTSGSGGGAAPGLSSGLRIRRRSPSIGMLREESSLPLVSRSLLPSPLSSLLSSPPPPAGPGSGPGFPSWRCRPVTVAAHPSGREWSRVTVRTMIAESDNAWNIAQRNNAIVTSPRAREG
jgi:hypothetical protein